MRLIDADAFRNKRKNAIIHTHERYGCEVVEYIDIINAPAIDPESLRPKGRWVEHEWAEEENGLLVSNFECSNCCRWERKVSDFCPNCGADMGEDTND